MASPHTSNVSTESRAGLPGSHASFTNLAALWLIALAGYAAIAFSSSRAGVVEIALDPARIKAELGPAYEIDLDPDAGWWPASRGDLLSAGEVSDLVLFDSHAELGPRMRGIRRSTDGMKYFPFVFTLFDHGPLRP